MALRNEAQTKNHIILLQNNVVEPGDLVVLTMGEPIGQSGGTNTMKIVRIGEHRAA